MNCTVTVKFNIYKKLQQTNAPTQNLPLHSDSLSPTAPAGSPRGGHRKGTFKETAPLQFPTTSVGLRRHPLVPPTTTPNIKLLVFSRGPDNKVPNSELSADSYKIFLSKGKG